MRFKRIMIGLVALLCAGFALWMLIVRPQTDEQRLIERLRSQVPEESGYEIDAGAASWSVFSPFDAVYSDVSLAGPAMGETLLVCDSLQVSLSPSSLLDRPKLALVRFAGARLHRRDEYPFARTAAGLSGTLFSPSGHGTSANWRLAFQGQQLDAQSMLTFLGAPFEMRAQVDLNGELIASGENAFSIRDSLVGQISLTGGPGRLDASAIDSLNRGVVRWARDSGHFVDWPDAFDFQRLEASFDVKAGLKDTAFSLDFENMSLDGSGAVDFFASEMNYKFELRFSSQAEDQVFRAGEYVADMPLPIRCVGAFNESLPCRIDRDALIDVGLQLIKEDAKDLLSRLFGEPE